MLWVFGESDRRSESRPVPEVTERRARGAVVKPLVCTRGIADS